MAESRERPKNTSLIVHQSALWALNHMKKLLFILLIAITGCQQKLPPPEIDFTSADDGKGFIQFTTTSLNATSFAWDFGDKSAISKEKNANHAYSTNGIYQVKLEATGPWGTTTVTKQVSVTGVRGSI